jgi:hypothetical protein
VGKLADQLKARGADETSARYAEEALAAGDSGPLLLMLLGREMLADVFDEQVGEDTPAGPAGPAWIDRWRQLATSGFPFIDVPAMDRLLAAGANPSDLTDVVRSAQMLTAYNIANLIDDPSNALRGDLDVPEDVVDWTLMRRDASGALVEVGQLHEEIMSWDPSGRGGAPRSLDLRRLQSLPRDVRLEVWSLMRDQDMSKAALLWKKHVGGDAADCLAAVERLRAELRRLTLLNHPR